LGSTKDLSSFERTVFADPCSPDIEQGTGAAETHSCQQPGNNQHKFIPPWQIEEGGERFDRSASLWRRNRQHSGRSAEAHWRRSSDSPSVRPDLNRAPALVSKIEVNVTAMFSDADVHRPLGRVEERAGFEQIERGPNRRRIEGGTGRLVMAAAQSGPKPAAADRPSLASAVDREIGNAAPAAV
jgi:hypothetical protein